MTDVNPELKGFKRPLAEHSWQEPLNEALASSGLFRRFIDPHDWAVSVFRWKDVEGMMLPNYSLNALEGLPASLEEPSLLADVSIPPTDARIVPGTKLLTIGLLDVRPILRDQKTMRRALRSKYNTSPKDQPANDAICVHVGTIKGVRSAEGAVELVNKYIAGELFRLVGVTTHLR